MNRHVNHRQQTMRLHVDNRIHDWPHILANLRHPSSELEDSNDSEDDSDSEDSSDPKDKDSGDMDISEDEDDSEEGSDSEDSSSDSENSSDSKEDGDTSPPSSDTFAKLHGTHALQHNPMRQS